jgi:hypothetical protein
MACTDVARAKAKATGINLIIDFLPLFICQSQRLLKDEG